MVGDATSAEHSLQWSFADQRVFDVIRPLARRLVFGVIGSAYAKPTELLVRPFSRSLWHATLERWWSMIEVAGTIVVVTAGIFLLMLGVLALLVPDQFGKFLLAFAQTSRLHFAELALRLVVGVSFLVCWPFMQWGGVFRVVGWVLIITTLIMVLVPWQKHREFACWAVPKALSYTSAVGVCSLVMGSFVVLALITGSKA